MPADSVVPNFSIPSEQEFHALLLAGLSRAAVKLKGRGALADALNISAKGLDKIFAGGSTHPKRLWDLQAKVPCVLDEIADRYGRRIVDKEAVCDTDDASVLIARLMLWLQEAQHPESPGGRSVVHTELTGAEDLIRQLHSATGNWIAAIDELRRPRPRAVGQ